MFCASMVVGMHLATYHFNRDKKYDEINPGVSLTCERYTAGIYHNSEGGVSVYAVKNYRPTPVIDLSVGVVVGYDKTPILPMVYPSMKLGRNYRLGLIVPLERKGGAIHLSYEW